MPFPVSLETPQGLAPLALALPFASRTTLSLPYPYLSRPVTHNHRFPCRIFAKNHPTLFTTYAFYPSSPTTLYHFYLPIVVIYLPGQLRSTAISRALDTHFSLDSPRSIYLNSNHVKLPLRRPSLCHCHAVAPSPLSQPPRSLASRTSCVLGSECPPSTAIQSSKKSQGASPDSCLQRIHQRL